MKAFQGFSDRWGDWLFLMVFGLTFFWGWNRNWSMQDLFPIAVMFIVATIWVEAGKIMWWLEGKGHRYEMDEETKAKYEEWKNA